jgi:hypothetical protein
MKKQLQHLNNSRIVNRLKVTIFAASCLAYIIWALPFLASWWQNLGLN